MGSSRDAAARRQRQRFPPDARRTTVRRIRRPALAATTMESAGAAAPPQLAPVDLRKVVKDELNRVQPQVRLRQGRLDLKLADSPLMVMGDSERLSSAMDNLLQNAVNFSPGPPEIEVVGDRQDGRV